MKKITLLGLFALLCATVMKAAVPTWIEGQGVRPADVTAGMEVVLRCPGSTLTTSYFAGATCVAGESQDIVWVLEAVEGQDGKYYLKKKNAASDDAAYVQQPAANTNATLVTMGAKATAGAFEFRALTEADLGMFNPGQSLDETYSTDYTGRLVVVAQDGSEAALRGDNSKATYAPTTGREWVIWNMYTANDEFNTLADYNDNNGPAIEQYILPAAAGVVGGFSADDLTEVKAAAEADNWAEANTALQALISSNKQIAFDADKYYTIESAQAAAAGVEVGLFESYTNTNNQGAYSVRWGALNGVASLWKISEAGTVTVNDAQVPQYHISALNSGKFIPRVAYGGATFVADESSACAYELEDGRNSVSAASIAATFSIKSYDDVHGDFVMLTAQKDGSPASSTAPAWRTDTEGCISSYKNLAVNWYLRPATSVSVTVPAGSQYATMNLPFAVELPDGVTAYVGGSVSDSEITLSPLDGTVVPAGCPVILTAEEGSYDLTIAYDNETSAPANSLSGTLVPQTVDADATAYIVANGSAGVGFYKITDSEDRTIPANKAYYTTNAETADAVLAFSFGPAVGIDGVTTADKGTDTYYDLQGRRVLYPAHGVYVKGNGEKVYIK